MNSKQHQYSAFRGVPKQGGQTNIGYKSHAFLGPHAEGRSMWLRHPLLL